MSHKNVPYCFWLQLWRFLIAGVSPATPYRIWRPSSENVPSRLQGQLHGTVFLQNCAPYQTVLFLRTSSKPIFLIWLLTFSRFRLPLFVFFCTAPMFLFCSNRRIINVSMMMMMMMMMIYAARRLPTPTWVPSYSQTVHRCSANKIECNLLLFSLPGRFVHVAEWLRRAGDTT